MKTVDEISVRCAEETRQLMIQALSSMAFDVAVRRMSPAELKCLFVGLASALSEKFGDRAHELAAERVGALRAGGIIHG